MGKTWIIFTVNGKKKSNKHKRIFTSNKETNGKVEIDGNRMDLLGRIRFHLPLIKDKCKNLDSHMKK